MSTCRELHRGNRTLVICTSQGAATRVTKSLLSFANVAQERVALYREAALQHLARGFGVVPILEACPSFESVQNIVDRDHECTHIHRAYIEGWTIRDWITAEPRPPGDATRLICQLLTILARVHQLADAQGDLHLVHRDITPGNVLVDKNGSVWLNDFGLARIKADGPLPDDETLQGTRSYLPPELLAGAQPSQASDIYQVAKLYQAMTHRRPAQLSRAAQSAWQAALAGAPKERPTASELEVHLRS